MKEHQLQSIEKRVSRTTPGPWIQTGGYIHPSKKNAPCVIDCLSQETYNFMANAEFICSSREDITKLIAEVRRLRDLLILIHSKIDKTISPK